MEFIVSLLRLLGIMDEPKKPKGGNSTPQSFGGARGFDGGGTINDPTTPSSTPKKPK